MLNQYILGKEKLVLCRGKSLMKKVYGKELFLSVCGSTSVHKKWG